MSHYRGLQAEPVVFRGYNGDQGEAYYANPSVPRTSVRGTNVPGKRPGIVVIHHLPGWGRVDY